MVVQPTHKTQVGVPYNQPPIGFQVFMFENKVAALRGIDLKSLMFYVNLPELEGQAQTPGAMRRLIAAGRVTEDTLVHEHKGTEWLPASTYSQLWEEPVAAPSPVHQAAYPERPKKKPSRSPLVTLSKVLFALSVISSSIFLFAEIHIASFIALFHAMVWWVIGNRVAKRESNDSV